MIATARTELPSGSNILRIALTGLTVVIAVLAVGCSVLASRYQQDMVKASRYNGAFDFSQAAVELLRLQVALDESRARPDPAQLTLRYNILRNRIAVIEENSLLKEAERTAPFHDLGIILDEIGPLLSRGPEAETIDACVARLRPFVSQLLRIASRAHSESGDMVLKNQQGLRQVLLWICAITLTLLLVGTSLIVLVLRQYKRLYGVARTDALTGLKNRLAFNMALRASAGLQRAVVLVDVDHFKAINDTLGHEAGDRLLCALATRLQASSRGATLARVGGDEFAILFSGPDAAADSVAFAERVRDAMQQAVRIEGRDILPSVTQGLCVSRDGDGSTLFNDADIALYAAKTAGRGGFLVFAPAMKLDFLRRQRLLEDMRQAVARHEFFLLYQPIVDLVDERPRGFEALLRWEHPGLGLVSPSEFIPLAEDSGLIRELGRWVIGEACRQAACWPPSMFVAVNVSARQLTDMTLADHVASCLAAHGLGQGRLEIEITESTLIENDAVALETLRRLRTLGCRISLDDFGTGYASLSYLRRFRFDKIKIDQSFVRGNAADPETAAIIAMICALAERLGLMIVAEGIETEAQRDIIREAGSHLGQGYLFHRPLTPSAIQEIILDGPRSTRTLVAV